MASSRSFGTMLKCESHPDAALIEDHRAGDMICSECGLVVGDRIIDVGSEWRTFANDSDAKDNSRVGATEDPSLGGSDLSTTIGRATGSAGFDDNGNPLYRNRNMESASEKAKRKANREIKEMAERLSADQSIINSAQHIFHTVHKNKLIKGRSNNAIIAACMFIACRQQTVPRTFKEISAITNGEVSIKDIGRCYKIIRKTLVSNVNSSGISSSSVTDLIDRFCSKLNLPKDVKKLATQIVTKINDIPNLTSRSPNSLAAAAIHLAAEKLLPAGERPSAEDIGSICGAAENTIKTTLKLMQPQMAKILPPATAGDIKPGTSAAATSSGQAKL